MRLKHTLLFSVALLLAGSSLTLTGYASSNEPTHKQARSIAPIVDGKAMHMNTFCVAPDSNLWMCCNDPTSTKGSVVVYTGEGDFVKSIDLSFIPQAINFAPNGKAFVAGSGKLARIAADGKCELEIEAPNIANREEAIAKVKAAKEKELEQIRKASEKQLKRIEDQIAKLSEEPEDEDEKDKKRRERRLKLLKAQQRQFEDVEQQQLKSLGISMDGAMTRWARATGIAVTDEDVYVSLPMLTGYGYSVWRLNHELDGAKEVLENLGGCCGQMDIQSDGEHLIVAENTKFQVGVYDREGKKVSAFGKRVRNDDEGFGSCCNPMNVRCCNGEILTAESSIGHIKRFSSTGEYLGFVGTAKVGGGCKHVAIGFDPKRDWHYMMNEDRSTVAVLVPRATAPAESEDERIAREALQVFGKKIYGTWELQTKVDAKDNADGADSPASMSSYIQSGFAHIEFSPDGNLAKGAKKATAKKEKSDGAEGSSAGLAVTALLSALTGSDEAAKMLQAGGTSKWSAIKANADSLDLITIEEGVPGFGANVKFLPDDSAEFSYFYGDPSSPIGVKYVYKRLSLEACGKDCSGDCGDCKKEEAK